MTSPRRLLLLSALAALIGLAGGAAAYVLVHLIALLTNLAFFHRVGWTLPSFTHLHRSPWIVVVAVTGGLIVARDREVGADHPRPRHSRGDGGGAHQAEPDRAANRGREADVGGDRDRLGRSVRRRGSDHRHRWRDRFAPRPVVPVSPSERKILLASGAAAGMAATFGAPLAAVVLAVELLIFEFSTRALIPLIVSASVAAGMHSLLFGAGPLFTVPAHHFSGLSQLPAFAVLGVACGLLAVVINKGLFAIEDRFRVCRSSQFWWPAIGALGIRIDRHRAFRGHSGSATTRSATCSTIASRSGPWRCSGSRSSSRGGSRSAPARRAARSRRSC